MCTGRRGTGWDRPVCAAACVHAISAYSQRYVSFAQSNVKDTPEFSPRTAHDRRPGRYDAYVPPGRAPPPVRHLENCRIRDGRREQAGTPGEYSGMFLALLRANET